MARVPDAAATPGGWRSSSNSDWWSFVGADRFSEDYRRLLVVGATRNTVAAQRRARRASGPSDSSWPGSSTSSSPATSSTACSTVRPTTCGSSPGWTTSGRRASTTTSTRWCGDPSRRDGGIDGVIVDRRQRRRAHRGRRVRPRDADRGDPTSWCRPDLAARAPELAKLRHLKTEWMNGIQYHLRPSGADRRRPRELRRLAVGAHVDLPTAVLGPLRPRRPTSATAPSHDIALDRHLQLGRAGHRPPQASHRLHRRRDRRGGLGPDEGPPRRLCTRSPTTSPIVVPRPRDPLPPARQGRERRAAARQHRRLVGPSTATPARACRTCSSRPTTCAPRPTSPRWRGRTRPLRRAVNAILAKHRLGEEPCELFELEEPSFLASLRQTDEARFARGEPNVLQPRQCVLRRAAQPEPSRSVRHVERSDRG